MNGDRTLFFFLDYNLKCEYDASTRWITYLQGKHASFLDKMTLRDFGHS